MFEVGKATENEMVLAFLQAEIDSTRFGPTYAAVLANSGINRRLLIDRGNLNSLQDNWTRKELLKLVRGYGNDSLLFRGFPNNVQWRRVALEHQDWDTVKYANHATWVSLSGGTRIVADGARNIDTIAAAEEANKNIKAVAADLRSGKRYSELIGAEGLNGEIVLLEGHTRATAYALARMPECVECILGSSPMISSWAFY